MNMMAEALMVEIMEQQPSLKPLSWQEHIDHGHVPYRRDCFTCQQSLQQQAPHRKVQQPIGGVLSLDTTGPFVRSPDAGGVKARYLLVGCLTWMVPVDSTKLREPEVGELEDEAPVLEDREPPDDEALALEDQEPSEEEASQEIRGEQGPMGERGGRTRQPDLCYRNSRDLGGNCSTSDGKVSEEEQFHEESEGSKIGTEKDDEAEEERRKAELQEAQQKFEMRTFRLASPMTSKKAREVTRATMDQILRLRADGFHVGRIHCDQGHEFQGHFKTWAHQRGIAVTRTAGDDPSANGRAEVAVKSIKTQIRRVLLHAKAEAKWWPWAARYVNEMNRAVRIDQPPSWPPFLELVTIRKRTWKRGTFETSTENVHYLCPAPDQHGHWVYKEGERPRVTKTFMQKLMTPVSEAHWIALEQEVADALAVRRRLRERAMIRKIDACSEDEKCENEKIQKNRVRALVEQEMLRLIDDDPELAEEEMKVLRKLKQGVEDPTEEEEILQTKIVSLKEVASRWESWLEAVANEVESLLTEKEAFKPVKPLEHEAIKKEAEKAGVNIEYIHSKLVATRKPGKGGGKKKIRWVVCGNEELKKPDEDNFSSGADAASLRIMVWFCSWNQWVAFTIDVKTAFLNAEMHQEKHEDILLVKPPFLLVEKGYLPADVLYQPLKAVYGFRRSPRLWGLTRDDTLVEIRVQGEIDGKEATFHLVPLDSEPNLWKLMNFGNPEDLKVYGLLMTYVDDLFVASSPQLAGRLKEVLQSTWTTSPPEDVTEKPSRFLGMEITKHFQSDLGREVWMITQQAYTTDLLAKYEETKERKIPITRDQALLEEKGKEEDIKVESVRLCQKAVGEVLWLATRSRPDIMFSVSRLGAGVTKHPSAVLEAAVQLRGYLLRTRGEGLKFDVDGAEDPIINVFTDASFAPNSLESHGSFIVCLGSTPIFWRSGRQSFVTTSTAEAEMTEIVEGMIAGESIYVIVQEISPDVLKIIKTDSMSALSILSCDGGSWRTRHLRLRSAFARQAISAGEWGIQHLSGENMLADIGTKALTGTRLEFLKGLMGMGALIPVDESQKNSPKDEVEMKSVEVQNQDVIRVSQAARVVQLITLAAAISVSKSEDPEESEEEGKLSFELVVFVYTLMVVVLTLLAKRLWKLGVRLVLTSVQWYNAPCGSQPGVQWRMRSPLRSENEQRSAAVREEVADVPLVPKVLSIPNVPKPKLKSVINESGATASSAASSSSGVLGQKAEMQSKPKHLSVQSQGSSTHQTGEQPKALPKMNPPPKAASLNDISFRMFRTRYGTVYHLNQQCRYLTAPKTGVAAEAQWCALCRRAVQSVEDLPRRGDLMYMHDIGSDAHSNPSCQQARGADRFTACKACCPHDRPI